jgi:hypothetical protein
MLVAARLRYVTGTKWGSRRYLEMNKLSEQKREESMQQQVAAV